MHVLIVCGVSAGAAVWLGVTAITSAMVDEQTNALSSIRSSRQRSIENHFHIAREQIRSLAQDYTIIEATRSLTGAFASITDELDASVYDAPGNAQALRRFYEAEFRPRLEEAGIEWLGVDRYIPEIAEGRLLQQIYIVRNPNPVGSKQDLDAAPEDCAYTELHARFHPRLRNFHKSFGYYDIFLFDLKGNLVYSVYKETDLGTNFIDGPYANSALGRAYREALESESTEKVFIADFEAYVPSYGLSASFLSAPVFDRGRKVGVAAFQLAVDPISSIISDPYGLGETGETHLVGPDMLVRADPRYPAGSFELALHGDTPAALAAQAGETGAMRVLDHRGKKVLSSYAPLHIEGLDWVIVAEMNMDEVMRPARALQSRTFFTAAVIAPLVVLFTVLALRRIVIYPLLRLIRVTQKIQGGNYGTRIDLATGDELASLAEGFNSMAQAIEDDIAERERAAGEIRTLRGLLPICSSCKKVRDDDGYWSSIEGYISEHSEAEFTHTYCQDCIARLYPEIAAKMNKQKES